MVEFACDNKDTEKLLRRLHKQVLANGGLVHDKLTIGCVKGDLKISIAGDVSAGERILILPKEALLPADKFQLELKRNGIVIDSHDDDLSSGQVDLMQTMVDIYNSTGKIESHKQFCTACMYFEDPDLLGKVLEGRGFDMALYMAQKQADNKQEFYLDSFIKTRVLGFRESVDPAKVKALEEDGVKVEKVGTARFTRTKVLMPIIDFINHHSRASGFLSRFADPGGPESKMPEPDQYAEDGIAVAKSCPVKGSNECYVSYGPFDPLDTLIHYNYPDGETRFTRSVPMKIELPGGFGTLVINASNAPPMHKKLPDQLKDLRFYLPGIRPDKKNNMAYLGFLLVPPDGAPRSMRRVIGAAVKTIGKVRNEDELMMCVQFAEKQVIEANIKYYEALRKSVKAHKANSKTKMIADNIEAVVQIQLRNIEAYEMLPDDGTGKAALPRKKTASKKSAKKAAKKTVAKKPAKKTAAKKTARKTKKQA